MKIMIVDDNAEVGEVLYEVLKKEHSVSVFTNVEEALSNLLNGDEVDLAIIDLLMPKVDGYLFHKILKQKFPNIVVAIMSDSQEELDKIGGIKITKPFNGEYIKENINRHKKVLPV